MSANPGWYSDPAADKVSSGTRTAKPRRQRPRPIRAHPRHHKVSFAADAAAGRPAHWAGRPALSPGCTDGVQREWPGSRVWPGGQPSYGQSAYDPSVGTAYADDQELEKKKSPMAGGSPGRVADRHYRRCGARHPCITGGDTGTTGAPAAQPSQDACPPQSTASPDAPASHPADGRVHVGPVSSRNSVPPRARRKVRTSAVRERCAESGRFGRAELRRQGNNWVASVLVGELQAGDGFFPPEQGSQIVVKCILGSFYGNNPVSSNSK